MAFMRKAPPNKFEAGLQSTSSTMCPNSVSIEKHISDTDGGQRAQNSFLAFHSHLLCPASLFGSRLQAIDMGISGLVAEYIVAIDVTRVRFPADAVCFQTLSALSREFGDDLHRW